MLRIIGEYVWQEVYGEGLWDNNEPATSVIGKPLHFLRFKPKTYLTLGKKFYSK